MQVRSAVFLYQSLGYVILDLHRLKCVDADETSWADDFFMERFELEFRVKRQFSEHEGNYALLEGGAAKFLRDYLQLAAKHGLQLSNSPWM